MVNNMGERDQKHYKHTRRPKIPVMFLVNLPYRRLL